MLGIYLVRVCKLVWSEQDIMSRTSKKKWRDILFWYATFICREYFCRNNIRWNLVYRTPTIWYILIYFWPGCTKLWQGYAPSLIPCFMRIEHSLQEFVYLGNWFVLGGDTLHTHSGWQIRGLVHILFFFYFSYFSFNDDSVTENIDFSK